jgi:TatD DNase family protein
MAALVDTHLHLARDEFDADRDAVRERAHAAGVLGFVHVGFDPESNRAAQAIASADPWSWATAGIHPHDASTYSDAVEADLRHLGREGRIVALGECGLDFFRDLSPRAVQIETFRRQLALAKELDLPLVFHVRDAYPVVRDVLEQEGLPPRRGVFHAFAGDAAFARWAVDEGFRLGIGGPLTYPRSGVATAIAGLPAASFLLETDAPWLPPQPWRGRRNEPSYLRVTAQRLAEQLDLDLDPLSEILAASFAAVFGVELPSELLAVTPSSRPAPQRGGR